MPKIVKAPASATIINAMATGFGSAFAIDLNTKITCKIGKKEGITCTSELEPNPTLMYKCTEHILKVYNLKSTDLDFNIDINAKSNIPLGSGLSSSSAISNGVCLALSNLLTEELDLKPLTDLQIINSAIDASIECGVTITGSFDDASSSYFGGLIISDNTNRKILFKKELEEKNILINMPETPSLSGKVDTSRIKLLSPLVDIAFNKALDGEYYNALNLNGLIYGNLLNFDNEIAIKALSAGALASGLSGSGSAYVAIVDDENIDNVKDTWEDYCKGEIIQTKINNQGTITL